MPARGWRRLLAGYPWFRKRGAYPLPAYSEFMPPPRLGRKPCGDLDEQLFSHDDEVGWNVSAHEEEHELRPGLEHIGAGLVHIAEHLGHGNPAHGISRAKLRNNPYWPQELLEGGAPGHERYVIITPLALSRTQDDKGRVRWTLFGGSEHGAARTFWRGMSDGEPFIAHLMKAAYGEDELYRFRILEKTEKLPKWARRFAWKEIRGVRYVLTFEPFATLPAPLRDAYRSGDVHLLPFPGSLLYWGSQPYLELAKELPHAMQIPLLHSLGRHESPGGIRIPQSGWLHEKTPSAPEPHPERGPFRQTFQRTHRWARVRRDESEIDVLTPSEDKVAHVLFSTAEDDVGLYGKPMARNAQIWSAHHELILDGPRATPDQLRAALERVRAGGTFGYRFFYPPMQVGRHEVYWHRPVVAFPGRVMDDAPAGYLTAYSGKEVVELWPRIERPRSQPTAVGVRSSGFGGANSEPRAPTSENLTYRFTARRSFETKYWNTIKRLAMGRFRNKDNADCVLDPPTLRRLRHRQRDLEALSDYLIRYYERLGARVGTTPFHWRTDFPFHWSDGWLRNQGSEPAERNVVVMIPGRDRKRAVIMADHYDTAYMEDVYGDHGPRLSARGADDNHSATAALMLAAPLFLQLSAEKKLACDIWLVHLTGEEFPSDCLGARHLTRSIVERTLEIKSSGRTIDVSNVEIAGVYVLDMIAHNNDTHRDVFQIAPGEGRRSMELAAHAVTATQIWNSLAPKWNGRQGRRGRSKRSKDGSLPPAAEHPQLLGDVRSRTHPHSTLYNTDGQIFSDAGIPVVLFMENYDINRHGYHDSHDTMENIDLDYGSAVAAIAIETVARAAYGRVRVTTRSNR